MKKNCIHMKHMMHSASDLSIDYKIDLISRTMTMNVDWIDTLLIESFLRSTAVTAVNRELECVGKLPLIKNVNGFAIEMIVGGKVRFGVQLVERDFEPRESTLVMKLKE